MLRSILLLICFTMIPLGGVNAQDQVGGVSPAVGASTGMVLPRFATLKSDNVYVRTGPSMDYPIRWIYKRDGLPVEIQQEFDAWRKIKMPDGETGWVHKILLAGSRTALIIPDKGAIVYENKDLSRPIVRMEKGVITKVEACEKLVCRVTFSPYDGWIDKKSLWGVYGSEIFN